METRDRRSSRISFTYPESWDSIRLSDDAFSMSNTQTRGLSDPSKPSTVDDRQIVLNWMRISYAILFVIVAFSDVFWLAKSSMYDFSHISILIMSFVAKDRRRGWLLIFRTFLCLISRRTYGTILGLALYVLYREIAYGLFTTPTTTCVKNKPRRSKKKTRSKRERLQEPR